MTQRKRTGRPKGSANREYARNDVEISGCPVCSCTDRTEYEKPHAIESVDDRDDGLKDFVVLRRCQCLHCGTHRVDRCFEVRIAVVLPTRRRTRRRSSKM